MERTKHKNSNKPDFKKVSAKSNNNESESSLEKWIGYAALTPEFVKVFTDKNGVVKEFVSTTNSISMINANKSTHQIFDLIEVTKQGGIRERVLKCAKYETLSWKNGEF